MVTVTLPSELERAVAEEAAQKGTTAQRLTLDVLQERPRAIFPKPIAQETTLADAGGVCWGYQQRRKEP